MSEPTQDEQARNGLASSLFDARTVTTLGLFSFFLLKVLSAVRFNLPAGIAVINTAGLVSVILGTIMLSLPYFIIIAIFYTIMLLAYKTPFGSAAEEDSPLYFMIRIPLPFLLLIAGSLTLLSFLILAWYLTLATPLYIGALYIGYLMGRRQVRKLGLSDEQLAQVRIDASGGRADLHDLSDEQLARARFDASGRRANVVARLMQWALAILAVLYIFSPQMWLPREVVTLQGQRRVVAYVLSDDGQWASLLTDRDREIVRFPSDSLIERVVCQSTKSRTASLWQLIQNEIENHPPKGQELCN
jgi:hypothetical protein